MEWKKHKYFVKLKTSPKSFRYFYSKSEYDAFKGNNKDEKKEEKKSNVVENTAGIAKNKAQQYAQIANTLFNREMDKKDFVPLAEKAGNAKKETWKTKGYKSYRDYKKAIIDGKENIPKKDKNNTPVYEDLKEINKYDNYNSLDVSYTNNCVYCTLAFDMRRRGYDVVAEDQYSIDNEYTVVDWYEGNRDFSKINKTSIKEDFERQTKNCPDGSYGQFCVYWKNGGGHSLIWYKENDQIYIYDSQNYGMKEKSADVLYGDDEEGRKRHYESDKRNSTLDDYLFLNEEFIDEAMYLRTDDLKLSKKALKKVDYN